MKHQVALIAYELDVFSIAGLGGFAPPAKNWGSGGQQGATPPSQKHNVIKKPFLEKALSRKAFNSMI